LSARAEGPRKKIQKENCHRQNPFKSLRIVSSSRTKTYNIVIFCSFSSLFLQLVVMSSLDMIPGINQIKPCQTKQKPDQTGLTQITPDEAILTLIKMYKKTRPNLQHQNEISHI
jgi:hypothetical protein